MVAQNNKRHTSRLIRSYTWFYDTVSKLCACHFSALKSVKYNDGCSSDNVAKLWFRIQIQIQLDLSGQKHLSSEISFF